MIERFNEIKDLQEKNAFIATLSLEEKNQLLAELHLALPALTPNH